MLAWFVTVESRFGSRWVLLLVVSTLGFSACSGRSRRLEERHGEGGSSGASGGSESSGGAAGTARGGSNPSGGDGGVAGSTAGDAGTGASGGDAGTNARGGDAGTDGRGGSEGGDAGSDSGGTGGVPSCIPGQTSACACTDGRDGAQICDDTGRYGPCECTDPEIVRLRRAIIGNWAGTRTSPWDGTHGVRLTFQDDGTWRAQCDDDCFVFYYGGYEVDPENGYTLSNVNDDGLATGRLRVSWGAEDSTQWGDLRVLTISDDETELRFEWWRTWGGEYGPLEFELGRAE